jgi:hypothetical protein
LFQHYLFFSLSFPLPLNRYRDEIQDDGYAGGKYVIERKRGKKNFSTKEMREYVLSM